MKVNIRYKVIDEVKNVEKLLEECALKHECTYVDHKTLNQIYARKIDAAYREGSRQIESITMGNEQRGVYCYSSEQAKIALVGIQNLDEQANIALTKVELSQYIDMLIAIRDQME